MAQLDRRIPGVYIDVEDRSFVGKGNDLERSAYVVVVSDRGPHNRVVEVTSWDEFTLLFGTPNFEKTGHAHYLAAQHLNRAKRLYVCRVGMDDATYGNAAVKYNTPDGSTQLIYGKYSFTTSSNTVSTDDDGILGAHVGDLIYAMGDDYSKAEKIIDINTDLNIFQLENPYTGATTTDDDMYIYYPGSYVLSGSFAFSNGSNTITTSPTSAANQLSIGEWVYAEGNASSTARQVIDVNGTTGELTLDDNYAGSDSTSVARRYIPFQVISSSGVTSTSEFHENDTDNLWYFYGAGVGSYYNNLYLRGVRNVEYETIYVDDNGDPLYKYAFMNLGVYEKQPDGTSKLVGGPWVVSLINTTKEGSLIRDIVTGRELYIETVINKYSKTIACKSALGVDVLLNDTDAELKRLQVLALLSEGYIIKRNTIGSDGVNISDGSDGSQYDSSGRLNLPSNTILHGLIAQAYEGTLVSIDGSVENLQQSIYPWYVFDYVYCGGYDPVIQNSARKMADARDDCLVLGDTGYNAATADEDLGYRQTAVPWNTYNAALYTQYRKIDDLFTGKTFYITPVYHAIDRHLYCDDRYWISEPVANIEKGALQESVELSYKPNLTKLGDMIDEELNPTITEPEGTYLITQLTTYKRMSILKRQHAIKFIHYLKHSVPSLLKDVLQRKATQYWKDQCYTRLNNLMSQFIDTGSYDRYVALTKYDVQVAFDEQLSEAVVLLSIWMIRAIEKLTVRIVVY